MNRVSGVLILTLAVAVAGSAHLVAQTAAKKTLYDSLGGRAAIVKVVDDFVSNCAADARINSFFAATAKDPKRMAAFKTNLVNQICEASGGPCKYTGKDMKTAHAGMGISNTHFDALVEDLQKTLDKFKVAAADQKTLLGVLGPMRSQIVERK
jgi:hemoglobin